MQLINAFRNQAIGMCESVFPLIYVIKHIRVFLLLKSFVLYLRSVLNCIFYTKFVLNTKY